MSTRKKLEPLKIPDAAMVRAAELGLMIVPRVVVDTLDDAHYGRLAQAVNIWRDPLWFWKEPEMPFHQRWRLRTLKRDVRLGGE